MADTSVKRHEFWHTLFNGHKKIEGQQQQRRIFFKFLGGKSHKSCASDMNEQKRGAASHALPVASPISEDDDNIYTEPPVTDLPLTNEVDIENSIHAKSKVIRMGEPIGQDLIEPNMNARGGGGGGKGGRSGGGGAARGGSNGASRSLSPSRHGVSNNTKKPNPTNTNSSNNKNHPGGDNHTKTHTTTVTTTTHTTTHNGGGGGGGSVGGSGRVIDFIPTPGPIVPLPVYVPPIPGYYPTGFTPPAPPVGFPSDSLYYQPGSALPDGYMLLSNNWLVPVETPLGGFTGVTVLRSRPRAVQMDRYTTGGFGPGNSHQTSTTTTTTTNHTTTGNTNGKNGGGGGGGGGGQQEKSQRPKSPQKPPQNRPRTPSPKRQQRGGGGGGAASTSKPAAKAGGGKKIKDSLDDHEQYNALVRERTKIETQLEELRNSVRDRISVESPMGSPHHHLHHHTTPPAANITAEVLEQYN